MLRVARQVLNYNRKRDVSYQNYINTYGCLATDALPELVKVDEELLNADSVSGDQSLDSSLDISFHAEFAGGLVVTLVPVLG